MSEMVQRLIQPLRSRKIRIALVTVLAAFAAEYGLHVDEELLLTIVGVGVSVVLGIALEDAGLKASGRGWLNGRQAGADEHNGRGG